MDDILKPAAAVHIPLASPATASTMLQVLGRGGIVRRQLPSTPQAAPGAQYSSHECVGDMSDLKPKAQRACLFKRVCLDTRTGEWNYYRRANVSLPPVMFERRYGHQFAFRHVAPRGTEEFLALNKHVRYKPHVRWSPVIVDGPAPAASSHVHWATATHLLSAPFVPTNLGHLVWEESFPLLLAMAQLGAYDEHAVVLRTHACNQSEGREPPTASEARLCAKFVAGFVAPLQGREHAAVETVEELRARHFPGTLCVSRLVGGGFFDVFNSLHHAGKEPFLRLFRQRVLAYHHVLRAAPPTQHTLLLVRKQGRRGIHNFDETLRFLRGGCEHEGGKLCAGIHRTQPISFHEMTIKEQLRVVSRATIAVSPPGGVSMILPFLPEGAHAILINYMAAERGSKRGLRGGGGAAAGAADGATNDDRRLLQMPPDRHDDDDDDAEPPGRRAAEGGGGGGKRGSKGHNKGQKGQKRGVRIVSSSCGPTRGPWRTQSSGTLPRRARRPRARPDTPPHPRTPSHRRRCRRQTLWQRKTQTTHLTLCGRRVALLAFAPHAPADLAADACIPAPLHATSRDVGRAPRSRSTASARAARSRWRPSCGRTCRTCASSTTRSGSAPTLRAAGSAATARSSSSRCGSPSWWPARSTR